MIILETYEEHNDIYNILQQCILRDKYSCVESILKQDIDIDKSLPSFGVERCGLAHAISNKNLRIIKLLLEYGADVNKMNEDGRLVIDYYIGLFPWVYNKDDMNNMLKILILLIDYGLEFTSELMKNLKHFDCGGKKLKTYPIKCDYENIYEYLKDKYPTQYHNYLKKIQTNRFKI